MQTKHGYFEVTSSDDGPVVSYTGRSAPFWEDIAELLTFLHARPGADHPAIEDAPGGPSGAP